MGAMSDAPTRWLDSAEQSSWRGLVVGSTLLMARLDGDLRATFNISLTEYEILVRLSESHDRCLRMAQVASALAHSRSRVTHTVKRLEEAGYVLRSTTPEDGRGVLCTMTDAGFALLEKAAHLHVTGVRENLVDLADPADFAALGRIMNTVADRLIGDNPDMDIR